MRAVLVVNPKATGTNARMRDVVASALAADLKIDAVMTERRGHATQIARDATADGVDFVIALGGDGTINEVVNGMLAAGPRPDLPALGIVPAGCTNVLARALGFPPTPIEATAMLLSGIREGRTRQIGLGRADERWFTFCAGIGFDAATVRRVEVKRATTNRVTPWQYARAGLAEYVLSQNHRKPAFRLTAGEVGEVSLMFALVCNTAPWSYLGDRPLNPCPDASFEGDLDVFGLTKMGALTTLRALAQMFGDGPAGKRVVRLHDLPELTLTTTAPAPLQVDGDYLGDVESVTFRSVPHALRIVIGA